MPESRLEMAAPSVVLNPLLDAAPPKAEAKPAPAAPAFRPPVNRLLMPPSRPPLFLLPPPEPNNNPPAPRARPSICGANFIAAKVAATFPRMDAT